MSQPCAGLVRVDPSRHAHQPDDVHRSERQVQPDEHQPEVDLAQPLVEQLAGVLRQPVVGGGEEREGDAADQHVVQVADDEVRVVGLQVERRRRPP